MQRCPNCKQPTKVFKGSLRIWQEVRYFTICCMASEDAKEVAR